MREFFDGPNAGLNTKDIVPGQTIEVLAPGEAILSERQRVDARKPAFDLKIIVTDFPKSDFEIFVSFFPHFMRQQAKRALLGKVGLILDLIDVLADGPEFDTTRKNIRAAANIAKYLKLHGDGIAAMVRSMYSDGGILVGSGIRAALRRALSEMVDLGKIARSSTIGVTSDSIDIKFSSLREERGIDLAIVATNTSLRKPVLFSHVTTPDFPVIEAVAISGAHPLLYKPIIMRGFKQEKVLNGVFADGGITLNLPLHIFDQSPRLAVGTKADLSEMKPGQLTPHMLAFELHEGNKPYEVIKGFSMPRRPGYDVLSYFLDVYEALQANANELQARGEEKEQIIPIFTGKVGTFDLHLRPSDANEEILAAAETVRHLVGFRSGSR